jgi:hypothetical protein
MITAPAFSLSKEWSPLLGIVCELVVGIVTIVARSSLRDVAGRIGALWGLIGVCEIFMALQYHGVVPRELPISPVVLPLYVTILVPGLLSWSGEALARRRYPIAGAMFVALLIPMLWLGAGRAYNVVVKPIAYAAILVVAAVALATTVRRARGPLLRIDAYWICFALVIYFALSLIWTPLLEFMYVRDRDLSAGLNNGRLCLEGLTSLAIAYGILRPARNVATPGSGSAASLRAA